MARSVEELEPMALKWTVRKMMAGEGASLVGVSLSPEGGINGLLIYAEDDDDMFEKARRAMRKYRATAFCLIGTGAIELPEGLVDIFIRYAQYPGDEHVRRDVARYVIEGEGKDRRFILGHWCENVTLPESWLGDGEESP